MQKSIKPLLTNNLYDCDHLRLTRADMESVDSFTIHRDGGKGLMDYIRGDAFRDEQKGRRRVYLVRDSETKELAGYFSLKAGMLSWNERVESVGDKQVETFDVLPGIELAEFAINDVYIEAHPDRKGSGPLIFRDFILPVVRNASRIIGVEFLYGFSVDDGALLRRYLEVYGFNRLDPEAERQIHERLRPWYDKGCTFIYRKM